MQVVLYKHVYSRSPCGLLVCLRCCDGVGGFVDDSGFGTLHIGNVK